MKTTVQKVSYLYLFINASKNLEKGYAKILCKKCVENFFLKIKFNYFILLLFFQGENGELKEYDYEYYDEAKPDSPFVNPHDPTHRQVS